MQDHENSARTHEHERYEILEKIHEHINKVYETKTLINNLETKQGATVLDLCGGIGTAALALKRAGIPVRRHIGVEIDPLSRAIAEGNHDVDHTTLPQDMWEITTEHLNHLADTIGDVDILICSTPCQGLSRANYKGQGLKDHRSALFTKAIWIANEMRKRNPKLKYIFENVDFTDNHPKDYEAVTSQLGKPEATDAANMSASRRKRLFWHNMGDPHHGPPTPTHGADANDLLEKGATLKGGATTAPCIMANWQCAHPKCEALKGTNCRKPGEHESWRTMATHSPVIVTQDNEDRQLKPEEAEALMGMPRGYTANTTGPGRTATTLERLARIGNAVDVNQLAHILRRLKPERSGPEHTEKPTGDPQTTLHQHVRPHTDEWDVPEIAKWLTQGPLPTGDDDPDWQEEWHLRGAGDLIRCCIQGFPLRYEGDRTRNVEEANGATCRDMPEVTADELRKEVAAGRIAGPFDERPLPGLRAIPRGLKEEPTKFRPLSMGNKPEGDSVNDGIPKAEHIQLARAKDIDRRIRACFERTGEVWMAKADIKAAYRTMPVRPEDWHLQGIKWDDQYYVDLRMSFGCRSSVDQWLRFSDALAWAMARWGVYAVHYVDDFIFIAGSEAECLEQVRKFHKLCRAWNVKLKEQADCGPAQTITALGIEYDLVAMTRRITPQRVQALTEAIHKADTSNDRRLWENITGVLWYVVKCVPIALPFLQPIMEATIRARKARKPVMPTATTRDATSWWKRFLATIQGGDDQWHGEAIIPTKTKKVRKAMGDAGSEWGMGGHDDTSYYKAPWTSDMWASVQRSKSTSSLHMEALQLLVMTRIMAPQWEKAAVSIELDSLGLVQTLRKGRHKDPKINDILQELALQQIEHKFELSGTWIRRCWNEAADALSKNDMPRFWANVEGPRTEITVEADHLLPPRHCRDVTSTGGMRRTAKDRMEWDNRPPRHVTAPILLKGNQRNQSEQLRNLLKSAVTGHKRLEAPLHKARAGVKHYLRFCERIGKEDDVAPDIKQMTARITLWLADAPMTYEYGGKTKKGLAAGSIPTYLTQIDGWWTTASDYPKGILQKQGEVAAERKLITGAAKAAHRQVHGITADTLKQMIEATKRLPRKARSTLKAAYTLAWYGMLRPTEYMLTPSHPVFDQSRHMRAGDIQLYRHGEKILHSDKRTATHMTAIVKQSKTDHQRMGATLTIGALDRAGTRTTCPVRQMQKYLRQQRPPRDGPLFPGLQYQTMLKTLRKLIPKHPELYGLHSFRVGGAQALALTGRSFEYIMAKGRWRHVESVIRYVETPLGIRIADSAMMERTERAPLASTQIWGDTHFNTETDHRLPRPPPIRRGRHGAV